MRPGESAQEAVRRRIAELSALLPPLTDEGRREAAAIFASVPPARKTGSKAAPAA